jgi:hypothetical protein
MMTIPSYIFQSPYPNPVQFGRPDPVAQAQQEAQENTEQLSTTPTQVQQEAQSYEYSVTSPTGSSVNVAASTADSGVSSSLAEFTTVNTQQQAAAAYSA